MSANYANLLADTQPRHFPTIKLGPDVSLKRGRIHELIGPSGDMFAALAAAAYGEDTVWIALRRDIDTLCPAGLQPFIDPSRLLLVEGVSRGELLWAGEQALRAEGAFTVILDMPDTLSLRESRRLQLAAEIGGGIGLIKINGHAASTAAQTRWQCGPTPTARASWLWHCLKGKNGEAGAWRVRFIGDQDAKDTLHMAPAIAA